MTAEIQPDTGQAQDADAKAVSLESLNLASRIARHSDIEGICLIFFSV